MKQYSAEIKEVLNEQILKPSVSGKFMTKEQLIEFWGLNNPDIEWFRLYEHFDNGDKKIM